jgi:hypothetical protein
MTRNIPKPTATSPADLDKMLDELEYEQIVRLIQRQPQTFYPALLITLIEAAYAKNVFSPGGASMTAAKTEVKLGKQAEVDKAHLAGVVAIRERQVENLAMLVVRLARALPRDNDLRSRALDYLARNELTPSVLREA